MTMPHWFTSGVAFSLIMHVITIKLFIETVYWNWLMALASISSLLLYYGTVFIGNIPEVSY